MHSVVFGGDDTELLTDFLSRDADFEQVQKRPYKECAGEKAPNITSECVGLRETYFNCKRGQASRELLALISRASFFSMKSVFVIVASFRAVGRYYMCM